MWLRSSFAASAFLAASLSGQQRIQHPSPCSIRLLEITPPAVDQRMVIPVKPIPNGMPAANTPAPPCPKEEVAVARPRNRNLASPVSLELMPKQTPKAPLSNRYQILPSPFRTPPPKR